MFFQRDAFHIGGNIVAFKGMLQLFVFKIIRIDLRLNADKFLFLVAAIALCGKYDHAAADDRRDSRKLKKTAVEETFFRFGLFYFRLCGLFVRLTFFCQLFSRSF